MSSLSVLFPVAATSNPSDLVRSHKSIIEQTLPPEETLLVTNQTLNKKTETAINDLVKEHSNTHHRHIPDAQGLGEVLTAGLKNCSGAYIARMDADDIAEPERFAEQLPILKNTNVDILGTQLAEFSDEPEYPEQIREVPVTHNEISKWMSWRCPMNHPTTMFNREAVLDVGGYRDFPMMEDWDLWARCLAAGLQFQNLDQVLVKARTSDLSDRRGGIDYAQAEVRMAQQLRELGISTRRDTVKHLCLRIPPRLLPIKMREKVYRRFVR